MKTTTRAKLIAYTNPNFEQEFDDFLASGIQVMAEGISWLRDHVSIMYREKGVLGAPLHTQLNLINNDVQNTQKKILQHLGKIDELAIRLDEFVGTDEAKQMLQEEKLKEEHSLDFQKKVVVKLKSLYAAVENGTLDTLNM